MLLNIKKYISGWEEDFFLDIANCCENFHQWLVHKNDYKSILMRLCIPLTSSTFVWSRNISYLLSYIYSFTNTRIMVWRFLHVSKSTIVSSNTAQNLAMSQGIAYQRRQSKNITNSFVDKTKLCTINYCKEVWLYQIFFSCFALFKQGIQIDIIIRIKVIAKIINLKIILSQYTYYRNKDYWKYRTNG